MQDLCNFLVQSGLEQVLDFVSPPFLELVQCDHCGGLVSVVYYFHGGEESFLLLLLGRKVTRHNHSLTRQLMLPRAALSQMVT
jgi:hypothetical protein